MSQPFCHLELNTPDLEAAKKFYGEMFGWTFNDMPFGEGMVYSTFKPTDGPGGGVMSMPGMPFSWLPYIAVEDINAATEKAVAQGAVVVNGPSEVPNMGWFTVLADPTGATIAIWQSTNM